MCNVFDGIPEDFSTSSPQWTGTMPLPRRLVRHENVAAIRLTDDSMYPEFPEGCHVVVDLKVSSPYLGEHVVVRLGDGRALFRTWTRAEDRRFVLLAPRNRSWGRGEHFDPGRGDRVLGVWLFVLGFNNTRRLR